MEHSLNIEIAKLYGIEEALVLNNIYFWVEKNKANEQNYYEGKYWTFNSARAFQQLFPYMNITKIKRVLRKLIDNNVIISGNFNKSPYDRTLWYTLTDYGYALVQNKVLDGSFCTSLSNQNEPTIPDINTDINTNNITRGSLVEKDTNKIELIKEIVKYMNTICEHKNFTVKQKFNFNYKTKITQQAINARLDEGYTIDDFKDVIYYTYYKFVECEFEGLNGKRSVVYFTPSLIFSPSKFDRYLNEYRASLEQ
ncbi:MAG: conserved phage C-terminal domain-containing protein [Clostridia bacterium]|nr:conserved phage C-terminal domain-containing protein [Clostridia bacterium]